MNLRGLLVSGLWAVLGAPSADGLDLEGLRLRLSQAAPGAVVTVPPGEYRGQLVLDRPVDLRAEPGARLVHEPGTGGPTLWIRSPGIRVSGLGVEGSGEGTRRDHTAVVVTAPGAILEQLTILNAWSGLWISADGVEVAGLVFRGLSSYPFWERGEGVLVTGAGVKLAGLDLAFTGDGLSLERARNTTVRDLRVSQARYGVHLMFGSGGRLEGVRTRFTVAGLMAMETSDWSVTASSFTEGYRTGSAGIRAVRTKGLRVEDSRVARQATGIELIDARDGLFRGNRIEENAAAWSWSGDNSGTVVTLNAHRGNLADASGTEPTPPVAGAHDHSGPRSLPQAPRRPFRPTFEGNLWDAWTGLDLDGDGFGDTAYRFDRARAGQQAARPWLGLLLGSPLAVVTRGLPGGEVLDPRPLVTDPAPTSSRR